LVWDKKTTRGFGNRLEEGGTGVGRKRKEAAWVRDRPGKSERKEHLTLVEWVGTTHW